MAEIVLTVNALAAAGAYADPASWTAGFNHAALVAAGRSRADAKDLYVRHTVDGVAPTVTVTGANTADCRVGFNYTRIVAVTDANYRLVFGNLARAVPIYASAGAASGTVTPGSVPSPTLPAGVSYDVTAVDYYGIREAEGLVSRRTTLHDNAMQNLRVQWRACSGEDAYEVRAVVAATKGGGTLSYAGYTYRIVPGSLEWSMESAAHFNAALELDLVTL